MPIRVAVLDFCISSPLLQSLNYLERQNDPKPRCERGAIA